MPGKSPARSSRPSRTAKTTRLAKDNARLRRALARERGRRRRLEDELGVAVERQEKWAAELGAGREQPAATAAILGLKEPDAPSILELKGLGKECWRRVDAARHVTRERRSWD